MSHGFGVRSWQQSGLRFSVAKAAVFTVVLCGVARGQDAAPVPAPEPSVDVAITVDGQPIAARAIAEDAEQRMGAAMLEHAALASLIEQAARKANVWPTETEIAAGLQRVRSEQFGGDDVRYEAWLHTGGRRESVLRREVAVQLAAATLRGQGRMPTEEQLRAWWADHRDAYRRPETYTYRMIQVPWPMRDGVRQPDDVAIEYANQELAALKDEPAFVDAARRLSEDPAAVRTGGLVLRQPAELLPPAFLAVFKAASPSAVIAQPVRFGARYVLLFFVRQEPATDGEFEQVRGLVQADLLRQNTMPQEEFVAALVRNAKIVTVDPRFGRQEITPRWHSPNNLTLVGWLISE